MEHDCGKLGLPDSTSSDLVDGLLGNDNIVFAFLVLLAFIVNTCKCVFMSYMDAVFISLERSLFHPHTLFTYMVMCALSYSISCTVS